MSSPDDITGIGRGAEALEKVTREFRELTLHLLNPAAAEAGEYFADKVRIFRFKAAIHALRKANALIEESGLENHGISLKRLIPMLEGASLEEDEDLVTKWAGLIASAATGSDVLPSFADILRQLTPEEARMLDYMFENLPDSSDIDNPVHEIDIHTLKKAIDLFSDQLTVRVQNLQRLELIYEFPLKPGTTMWWHGHYGPVGITVLGRTLVKVCRGPTQNTN